MPAEMDGAGQQALLKRVLERAGGEAEAWLGGGRHDVTRFAQNAITQAVSEEDLKLSLRLVEGERTGRATTDRLDERGLADVIASARTATRAARPIAGLLPVPGPMRVEPLA